VIIKEIINFKTHAKMSLEKYIAKLFYDLNNLFSWLFLMTSFKMFELF